jgi:hypothetical protein
LKNRLQDQSIVCFIDSDDHTSSPVFGVVPDERQAVPAAPHRINHTTFQHASRVLDGGISLRASLEEMIVQLEAAIAQQLRDTPFDFIHSPSTVKRLYTPPRYRPIS